MRKYVLEAVLCCVCRKREWRRERGVVEAVLCCVCRKREWRRERGVVEAGLCCVCSKRQWRRERGVVEAVLCCVCSKRQWRRKKSHFLLAGQLAQPPMDDSSLLTTMITELHGSVCFNTVIR